MPPHLHRPRLTEVAAMAAATTLLVACSDELVQTAKRQPGAAADPGGALDCSGDAPPNTLPPGAQFGDGDPPEASSPLAGFGYGPQQGPGLYVIARDTFRVYVNGQLVGQSDDARTSRFFPLSLLPGENVIALAVHAHRGAPAALVQLEELERSYGSGGDWKLSSSPQGDWRATGYDDSAWAVASELGDFDDLSGCDPATFPPDPVAKWIGADLATSGPIALRKTIRIVPTGFGAATTGGAAAPQVLVNTWEDLEALASSDEPATILLPEGVHDFRRRGDAIEDAEVCPSTCADQPDKVVHRALTSDFVCTEPLVVQQRDARTIALGSNKTIVGLGRGAAIRGVSFEVESEQNVIFRNIAFFGINPHLLEARDALTIREAERLWIDHATFKWVSDAFLDVHAGTRETTISYALFDGGTDGECGGQERWGTTFTDTHATIHHSRFDQLNTRAPAAEGPESRIHLFNNVHSNTTGWTVGSECLSQVLLEGSFFENTAAATRISTCDTGEAGRLNAVAGTNLYRDESAVHVGGDGTEPHDLVFEPGYAYELEPAAEARLRVLARAGFGGPWALSLALD